MSNRRNVKGYLYFALLGWLFFFCQTTERELAKSGNIIWDAGFGIKLVTVCIFAGTLTGCGIYFVLSALEKRMEWCKRPEKGTEAAERKRFSEKRVFLLSWLGIAVCWLPFYLAYYPAICSYDITIQLGQISSHAYNDHHPIFHTILIEAFMKIGTVLAGSVNFGIALYALTQMLALAAVYAVGVMLLYKFRVKRLWMALILLYCCFFPFHGYMSVSVVKDTLFSAFFLMQLLLLWQIIQKKRNTMKPEILDTCYIAAGMMTVLFRNNGKYALLVLLVVFLLAVLPGRSIRRLLVRTMAETAVALAAGVVLLNFIFVVSGAQQGDRRELLSLPIQQLARTYIYHGGIGMQAEDDASMSEEDKALIDDFILNQGYMKYRPDIADPVKNNTNTYVARYRSKDFLRTYFRLFAKYPGDYLNAALAVNAGYLYLDDTSHAWINDNGRDRGLGYVQTRWVEAELNSQGIYKDSKWEWLHGLLEEFADSNGYLNIPLLKYIMAPGAYLWLWGVLAAWLLAHKKFLQLIPLSLVLGYYLTLFLGPTVQLRYLYPTMIALPFLAVLCLCTMNHDDKV